MTPVLNTPRLVLRPLMRASQRQIDWLRDPKVVEFSEQRHVEHTLGTQLRYINGLPAGSHIWAIYLNSEDRHIGNMAARADMPNQIVDLGILIGDREAWGHGYGTEAFKTATEWLLDKDGGDFRKVEAGCMALNIPMRRVLDHTHYRFEGERKNHFLCNGQLSGAVHYGKFR